MLDYVVPYVKERHAFGEPIAHRQAVAFMCANIAIEFDGLRLITWRGASRADQGLPFAREAALAKRFGSDKGMILRFDPKTKKTEVFTEDSHKSNGLKFDAENFKDIHEGCVSGWQNPYMCI